MVIWFNPLELKLGCAELLLPRSFKNVATPLHRRGLCLRFWLPCTTVPFELNWLCWTRLSRNVCILTWALVIDPPNDSFPPMLSSLVVFFCYKINSLTLNSPITSPTSTAAGLADTEVSCELKRAPKRTGWITGQRGSLNRRASWTLSAAYVRIAAMTR